MSTNSSGIPNDDSIPDGSELDCSYSSAKKNLNTIIAAESSSSDTA